MSAKNPSDLAASQLQEKLRELGLSSVENRAELTNRLIEADASDERIERVPKMPEASATQEARSEPNTRAPMSLYEQEIELYRREKELVERELQLARRELELVREMQRLSSAERDRARGENDTPRVSIAAIADLLGRFDGSVSDYKV